MSLKEDSMVERITEPEVSIVGQDGNVISLSPIRYEEMILATKIKLLVNYDLGFDEAFKLSGIRGKHPYIKWPDFEVLKTGIVEEEIALVPVLPDSKQKVRVANLVSSNSCSRPADIYFLFALGKYLISKPYRHILKVPVCSLFRKTSTAGFEACPGLTLTPNNDLFLDLFYLEDFAMLDPLCTVLAMAA